MLPFFEQITGLLTSPDGSLAYHLVLGFSIVAAFLTAATRGRDLSYPPLRRMLGGFGLLLAGRLAFFLLTALAGQGVIESGLLLPVFDRLVTLTGLLVIIWLWTFPEPSRSADAAVSLLGMLALAVVVLSAVWWQGQQVEALETTAVFNGSFPDRTAEITAVMLAGIGLLLLLSRRPPGWGFGLFALLLSLAGHLAHLFFPITPGAFPGMVRLGQLFAYPLLLYIPARFPVLAPDEEAAGEEAGYALLPDTLRAGLDLAGAGPGSSCQELALAVGRAMRADICLYFSPPWNGDKLEMTCGYDLVNDRPLAPAEMETGKLTVLTSALRQSRPLRVPATRSVPDLSRLGRPFGVEHTGALLVIPVSTPDGDPLAGLVLLSPFTHREWTQRDLATVDELKRSLARFLQHQQQVDAALRELPELREKEQAARRWLDDAQVQRDRLVAELDELRRKYDAEQARADSLAAVMTDRDDLQETLERLQAENETLRGQLDQAQAAGRQQLEGELREAQREIAMLKDALTNVDHKMLSLSAPQAAPLSGGQAETITSIVQDLRQTVANVFEFAGQVLNEKAGMLSVTQRRPLEKIRAATDRMNRMLDELVLTVQVNPEQVQATAEPVDLPAAIQRVVERISPQLQQSRLALQVEMPESLPPLRMGQETLEGILMQLLQNAAAVTPEGGEIQLRSRLQRQEGQPDFVLLQVTDHGRVIPVEEQRSLFSPHRQPAGGGPVEVGDARAGLPAMRTLVKAQGGEILVDSNEQQGTTFSLVLPVPEDETWDNGQPRRAE